MSHTRMRQDRINAACARYRAAVEAYRKHRGPVPSVRDYTADLTPDERLAVHDYAYALFVEVTHGGMAALFGTPAWDDEREGTVD